MRKLRRAGLFILLGVLLGSLAFYMLRPREPVYQGKRLSAWLQELDYRKPEKIRLQAEDAFRHFGTNAVLPLLTIFRSEDSKLQWRLRRFFESTLGGPFPFPSSFERQQQAASAFQALGPA